MPDSAPIPISTQETQVRLRRIRQLAKKLGCVGKVEYRHVYAGTGGAQYCVGVGPEQDVFVVSAEAFDRDAVSGDFSLGAMLAHERGHQCLVRNPALSPILARQIGLTAEEILASLIGSLLAEREQDRQDLYYKALYDTVTGGLDAGRAVHLLRELRVYLELSL